MFLPMAATLIAGIGFCSQSGDYCPSHIAKIAIEQTIYSTGNHSLVGNLEHISDPTDGRLLHKNEGDRGQENLFLLYKYDFGGK